MSEMTDRDRKALADLIEDARRERKWIYHNSLAAGPLWFTPNELAAENAEGRFRWGVVNWHLRDPADFVVEVTRVRDRAVAEFEEQYERFKRWCVTENLR